MTIETAAAEARKMYRNMETVSDYDAAVMYFEQIAANSGISYESWLLDNEGSEIAAEGFHNFSQGMK
jgi:hypothetical protein